MYLLIMPNGAKRFQMKYRYESKERTYSIGVYGPRGVSLKDARDLRDQAKRSLADGHDPTSERRLKRAEVVNSESKTVIDVSYKWLELQKKRWSTDHYRDVTSLLSAEIFPRIGKLPIRKVTSAMVATLVLDPIEKRGALVVARRARQRLSAIYRYAAARGYVDVGFDPAGPHLLEGLTAPRPVRRNPAIVELSELRALLDRVDTSPAAATTKLATRFVALTFVRTETLTGARWEQFEDLDGSLPLWDIPKEIMKGKKDHKLAFMIPLSRQAVDIIEAARKISGECPWVFPSDIHPESSPISNNAILFNLYRLGYRGRHTTHGFRASFSTIMNNKYAELAKVIDFAIAHVPPNTSEAAYNRAEYLEIRRKLHQEYADMLFEGFPPASSLLDGPRR